MLALTIVLILVITKHTAFKSTDISAYIIYMFIVVLAVRLTFHTFGYIYNHIENVGYFYLLLICF